MVVQVRLKGERWKRKRLAWLASVALARSWLRLGQTKLRWHKRKLEAVASAEQLRGRQWQARVLEREWVLG